ncbi:GntR family transcriptional regulator [Amycolatopsis endophytica]|uniref:DNA-binding GntR family transcriptional regulator n=1 Tax=Amycolatopsis endophytica TaxID=860233 RepID=A0A853BB89_9PSEU|nr:GntR family transcriptional regulator [Amycolatopsis endophytica]NYI92439.1 DNA-binding GntR family transcriptional regulator [Amycolatopsis endophytica]
MGEPVAQLVTKSEMAYDSVREKILSGEFPPGSVINQATLARAIGISTTPLREALRRLKAEGLVELDAHRDAHVAELRAEEARDLLEMRRSLDPLAASLAAERRSRSDIAEIRDALAGLEPLPGNPGYEHLLRHRRFHRAIYRASHNDLLIDALEGLWDKADRYRRLALEAERTPGARARTSEEHRMLMECVAAGDGDGAAAVMREHIDTSLGAQAAWRLRES